MGKNETCVMRERLCYKFLLYLSLIERDCGSAIFVVPVQHLRKQQVSIPTNKFLSFYLLQFSKSLQFHFKTFIISIQFHSLDLIALILDILIQTDNINTFKRQVHLFCIYADHVGLSFRFKLNYCMCVFQWLYCKYSIKDFGFQYSIY